jgi:hypothetical protein
MVLASIGGAVLWLVIAFRAMRAHETIATSLRDIARAQRPPPRRTKARSSPHRTRHRT